nr:DUF4401 domain-containing protein [Pantoea sp. 201603H]
MSNPFYAGNATTAVAQAARRLQLQGVISAPAHHAILLAIGARPDARGWLLFIRAALALTGVLSLVCGAIFFFAWNWQFLPRMAKFALIEGLIIALALLVWWRWARMPGQLAMLAIGFLLGVLFAVYGQIYQTGAESWLLFCNWAIALFALACFARLNVLWFLCWLVANIACALRLGGWEHAVSDVVCQLFLLATLALRFVMVRHRDWLFRIMLFWTLVILTLANSIGLFSPFTPSVMLTAIIWLSLLCVGYQLCYRRQRDLFVIICGLFSIGTVLVAGTVRIFIRHDIVLACTIALIVLGLYILWVHHWMSEWHTKNRSVPQNAERVEQIAIGHQLQEQALLTPTQVTLLQSQDVLTDLPWYVHVAFVLCGWFTGLMTFAWLVLICLMFNLFDDVTALPFGLMALVSGIPASILLRKRHLALQQIGLSWAMTSTVALCVAGIFWWGDTVWWEKGGWLVLLPPLALLYVLFHHGFYRYLNSTALVFFLINGLILLPWLSSTLPVLVVTFITAAVILLGVDDRYAWRYRPLLLGIASGLFLLCFYGSIPLNERVLIHAFIPSGDDFSTLNEGVAAGLLLSALVIGRRKGMPTAWQLLLIATLLGATSLFMPGIALAWLLILLARYQNSKVLMLTAAALLVFYTLDWYYFLSIPLLNKALMLLLAGILLLLIAALAHRRLQGGEYA